MELGQNKIKIYLDFQKLINKFSKRCEGKLLNEIEDGEDKEIYYKNLLDISLEVTDTFSKHDLSIDEGIFCLTLALTMLIPEKTKRPSITHKKMSEFLINMAGQIAKVGNKNGKG